MNNELNNIHKKQLKRVSIFLSLISIFAIILPILLDYFVIGNEIKSNITNEQWVGFLGNYTGAIIGSVITVYALIETLIYNNNENNRLLLEKEKEAKVIELKKRPEIIIECEIPKVNEGIQKQLKFSTPYVENQKCLYSNLILQNIGGRIAENVKITLFDVNKSHIEAYEKIDTFLVLPDKDKIVAISIIGFINNLALVVEYDDNICKINDRYLLQEGKDNTLILSVKTPLIMTF
ncbi:MAG: hypothetical protein ACK5LY_06785 [Lachnospirales bacterium]